MPEALRKADEVLQQAVQGITDLINLPALINLDFADVQTVMTDKGIAHIGIGEARGDDKAMEAVQQAVSSPLLLQAMYRSLQVKMQISSLVLCMMTLLLIMRESLLLLQAFLIMHRHPIHLEIRQATLYLPIRDLLPLQRLLV